MIILRKIKDVENWVKSQKEDKITTGFVPTMGALHEGHISLVNTSKNQNDKTIVTLFVNPTQFNNQEDLVKYPRTEDADILLLEKAGTNAVFIPTVDDIYPDGQNLQKFDFNGLENQMEGRFRPGHFDGVGTVIKRFFEIIHPTRAYFGEKDFQQLRIIQQLVENEKLEVQIVPVPIKREADGLAMSSRNTRLTDEFRKASPTIYKILKDAKDLFQNHSILQTKEFVIEQFSKTNFELEYVEIADETTLISSEEKAGKQRIFVAVYAGEIRLIDNLSLN